MVPPHTDFSALADAFPPLKPWLVTKPDGSTTIDFHNDQAQRYLTKALLHRDFGLTLDLPPNRLCPPVPNRLNYVLWIQDIARVVRDGHDRRNIRGIDIGTGASVIYPLLSCRMKPEWTFIATEIDKLSIQYARRNIESNNLKDRIALHPTTPDRPILSPLLTYPDDTFDFTMCNPPFYNSAEEAASFADAKQMPPNAICTGAHVEMITPGGEIAFVSQMVRESLEHRTRCSWYTSMLGRMSSVFDLVAVLRRYEVSNYAVTEFVQGKTRRWGIAWSFTDLHLPDSVGRASSYQLQEIMPPRNDLRRSFPYASKENLAGLLVDVLASVNGVSFRQSEDDDHHLSLVICAIGDTWSRAARRGNKLAGTLVNGEMRCRVAVVSDDDRHAGLQFQWVKGTSRALYESFCNHIGRKVEQRLAQ